MNPTIKHIVIAGGGPTCIKALGALQVLEQNNIWKYTEIETIYATSGGAILGVLICLQFQWSIINDYVLLRPWQEVYHFGVNQVFDAFENKGIFNQSVIEIFLKPFFKAKDISLEITMKEFFLLTNIELHMFTLEINEFEIVDVSYLSHPDLSLLTALHMTCAIPIVIAPVCIDNKCYVDGGVISNYPLSYCLKQLENRDVENKDVENKDEGDKINFHISDTILGIRNNYNYVQNQEQVNPDSTILEYIFGFMNKLMKNISTEDAQPNIKNELIYSSELMNFSYLSSTLSSLENRKILLDDGIKTGEDFLQKIA